jgi:muconolactone delta-isomerase
VVNAADQEVLTMEYLVTMTTHVPEGTSEQAVDDVRAREAARSAQLTDGGYLIRLWRPPLQPGEWRSIGLFAAPDEAGLKEVLASMPLHVWRSDEIMQLSAHRSDPAVAGSRPVSGQAGQSAGTAEFLTTFNIRIPAYAPGEAVGSTEKAEAERAHQLAEQGKLLRLWMLPAPAAGSRALGLWRARDAADMQAILESLPLDSWMTVETTPLTQHPSDPALTRTSS